MRSNRTIRTLGKLAESHGVSAGELVRRCDLLDHQRTVLEMRLQGIALQAIGRVFDVKRERVRQVETKALRKVCGYEAEEEKAK